ncbi:MAG: hypothetical protein K5853_06195 [Lachnospiraceae bacterium]|nr:hypothetical protein [Lachnospiraceae bacterium]
MSSLVKWQFINDEDEHVIDSNSRIAAKMEAYKREIQKKSEAKKKALIDDFYNSFSQDEEGNTIVPMDENGNIRFPFDDDGNQLVGLDEEGNIVTLLSDEPESDDAAPASFDPGMIEEAQAQADRILYEARRDADTLLDEARQQAEALKDHYTEDGKKNGYQEGLAQAMQEFQQKEAQLEAEKEQIRAAYRQKEEAIEKKVVDAVCDFLEKFFTVQFGDSKELLLHLVDNCILNIENSKTFLIKVNEAGYEFLSQNKDKLQERVGSDAQIDIVRDPVLSEGACIIETDGGVFDCSLDTEMRNLIKDIRSLNI